ncbi:AAA family ATPase [Terrabacter sp. GCM10028922]|uniref:helix-turn-helix transcriptional regulator n=1 Tax=Terrabacter sp. GCM10028922 TaxID=3273428 RepID=UPI00361CB350
MPLVGRRRELTALRDAVTSAAVGHANAILLAGEAGGGKSRLLGALVDDLPDPQALVLRAQCVDLGGPGLPYLALVDLVRAVQAAAALDPELAAVLDRAPFVSALADPSAAPDETVDESRPLRLFDAMATLLGELGRVRGPVVVTVEDLQWLDSSSTSFLRFLLSRMSSERLAVVATVRTDGVAARPRVRQLLSELGRLPTVRRLDLEPFSAAEVAEFLGLLDGDPPTVEVAAEVARRTRGNPYYIQALAAAVGGVARVEEALPRALADLLVGALDRLPDDARNIVRAAAVVSHPVPDHVLRSVATLDQAATEAAVRVAMGEGLLTADSAGYSLTHDLLRAAVYADLLPGERARLHAAYGAALEAATGGRAPAAEVAHHYAEAQDAPKTLEWSVRAAEDAMRVLAPSEALGHLEQALAVWPGVPSAAAVAGVSHGGLATRAARAAGLAGETSQAIEWAGRAIRLCDADSDVAGAVQSRAELVRQLVAIDATDQVVTLAEEAVRLTESSPTDAGLTALAHVALARALLAARRTREARPQAERAVAEANTAGERALEVDALTTAAFLDEIDGDREGAAKRLRNAAQLARAEGELAAELRAHYTLACLHYYNGDVSASLPVLQAAMSRVTESGLRWSDPGVELRVLLAVSRYTAGDLHGSLEAAATSGRRPPDAAAARLAAVSCYAAVALGLADAERRLADLHHSWGVHPQVALVAGGCDADRLAWAGDSTAAVAAAERAQQHLDSAVGEGMYGGLWLSAIGLAALADGAALSRQRRNDAEVAVALRQGETVIGRVERIVEGGRGRPGELGPEGLAWRARAVAEHARLQGRPAVQEWLAALDAFGYGHVYEQARCHWRLAEALVAAGDRDAARAHASEAAASAEQLGALPLQRAVAGTVSAARLAVTTGGGVPVLTGRERDVLALVAEGLTNREIGRRLFISEKTVSVHLSNLMAKLNVSSRTEAVTVAVRRGLHDVLGSTPSA